MAETTSEKGRPKFRIAAQIPDEEQPLSQEWTKEITRRLKDSRDPVRYMIASVLSPRFVLYYDVSSDSFAFNQPANGTLFKRRKLAERVMGLLGKHYTLVKFTTKNGTLKRLSPLR